MKRIIFSIGIMVFTTLKAAPVGNSASCGIIKEGLYFSNASWYNARVGYEGDFIVDRRLKSENDGNIDNFKQCLNSGSLTINILNRLDIFGILGQARLKTNWIIEEGVDSFSYIEIETKFGNAWSLGSRAIFFEWGDILLSFGGRYSYTNPRMRWVSKDAEITPLSDYHIKFDQWQIDMELAYKIDMFIPYAAVKYSKAKVKLAVKDVVISSDGSSEMNMKSRNHFGMALGSGFSSGRYFLFNVETRLFDEEAFSVSGEFKF